MQRLGKRRIARAHCDDDRRPSIPPRICQAHLRGNITPFLPCARNQRLLVRSPQVTFSSRQKVHRSGRSWCKAFGAAFSDRRRQCGCRDGFPLSAGRHLQRQTDQYRTARTPRQRHIRSGRTQLHDGRISGYTRGTSGKVFVRQNIGRPPVSLSRIVSPGVGRHACRYAS